MAVTLLSLIMYTKLKAAVISLDWDHEAQCSYLADGRGGDAVEEREGMHNALFVAKI